MIYERLKELRNKNGITQSDLAKFLNVSQGTIGNWESGNRTPDLEMIIKIALYFNVSTDYLLGKSDSIHFFNNINGNGNVIQHAENGYCSSIQSHTPIPLEAELIDCFNNLSREKQLKLLTYAYELAGTNNKEDL